ncbi:GH36-type glycosyl hydrolase domain-containing protein [Rhodoferax sp.]|uniref:GH36-type glycosyl hydrolase domain-containing protein n=1 Tax=Rhodoferax sp. TaxID=50421 RepID=UPI002748021A|nr:glucoamylase family protein [Rhodoferax sp.]
MAHSELQRLVPAASAALCAILHGARGALQAPIRSEIFGLQRLAQHGRSLGETHRAARAGIRPTSFFPRLRDNIRVLREAHQYIAMQATTGYDISPAGEWLLDNFHLIEAQLEEVHAGLPRRYFQALPVLQDEPLAGLPRVYGVAWAFVAHTDGAFDEHLLLHYLQAYQETRPLNLSELWALPTTLRVVLVENLRRLAERAATHKAAREIANLCCDGIERCTFNMLDRLLAELNRRGVGRVFLAQLARRLQEHPASGEASYPPGYQDWLHGAWPELATAQTQQGADQAADNLSVSNAVTSLRTIGDADWPELVARTSALMRLMLTSKMFEAEHTRTRDRTLHGIEHLARRCECSEVSLAQTLLGLMRTGPNGHAASAVASHWLEGAGRPELVRAQGLHGRRAWRAAFDWRSTARRGALPAYLAGVLLGTLGVVGWLLVRQPVGVDGGAGTLDWWSVLAAALMLWPASEAVVAVINRLISESARPDHLPRLALAQGIPPEHRVLVVIPGMLTSAPSVRELVHRLTLHYLANPEREAQFALLSDWADADAAHRDGDAALLDSAAQQLRALNQRYPRPQAQADAPPRFILLHRERQFCQTEQRWIGWERKRGKLEQLVAALAQGSSSAFMDLGELSRITANTPYIVTLDSDTQLPPERLRDLVGVAAHPHNQPKLDATARRVVSGYGILQPRVATPLPAQRDFTLFHWLFAGQCGIDPYSAASSEVYQDLFAEGTFTGKGLLHVRAMHAVLAGRLPEGRVLSHDLLDGSLARCAGLSEITVIEDAPFHADVAASRVHRWTRGDWQLLALLLSPARFPLRAINRWKMFDNLRRSLVAPMSLALLLLALAGAVLSPWAALALVLAAFSAGPLLGAVAGFAHSREDLARRHFYRQALTDLARAGCAGLWHLAQLPHQAMLALDAIGRALYRSVVSQRHLLQWTTAAAAQASAKGGLRELARQHRHSCALAVLLLVALWAGGTPHRWLTLALCTAWAASPVWTWLVSRPRPARDDAALSAPEQAWLEGLARDTWRFFERCVGAPDHHLPPDNLQTLPHEAVAHRTSPTNIGLYLLSVACARQFGWIGTQELLARLQATLASLAALERHRGHLLNWYDTETRAALLPRYVSTVDSGNLSGHLLALAQACLALALSPYDQAATQHALQACRQRLAPLLARRGKLSAEQRQALRWLLADYRATRHCAQQDLHASALEQAPDAPEAASRLRALAAECERLAGLPDFAFLYHPKRHLLHIGYRVAEQQLDASFYDLLASEARLTSLLAIAKGDVPVRHWASLGRPFYALGAKAGLRSWSGSMFEYLMPCLVLDEPHGSVLRNACQVALREQIAFARAHGVPWGVSESAHSGRDHTLAYQYAPHGVPRLALRRTPPDELVVAPYATLLAAQIEPHAALANLHALEGVAARTRYGFVESLDFTPGRQDGLSAFTPVCTFMSHHQGMTIVALANVLHDGVAQRWGMANAPIEAVASMLHERAPREVPRLYAPTMGPPAQPLHRRASELLRHLEPGATALEPTQMLSNGRYSVTLRANGAGWSRWGQTGITRWRDDALRDDQGSFFYLRRLDPPARQGEPAHAPLASLTQHPAADPAARYTCTYHANRVCFETTWADLTAHTTVWVSPEDDIEFRQIELRNLGDLPVELELVSAFDVTLCDPQADEAHPAFTNLFVNASWLATQQALWFERKPRLPTEPGLQLAHFLADAQAQVLGLRCQTDRQRWLGRNHLRSQPRAGLHPLPPVNGEPTVRLITGLDPVCALAVRLRIAANARGQLTFATAVCDAGATLRAVIDKYREPSHIQRSALMATTLIGIRLRALRISARDFVAIQTLTTALVQSLTRARDQAPRHEASTRVCDRRLLWRFGLSGERALILVAISVPEGLGLVRALAQALRLWSWGGVACDLVIVNAEPASYLMALQRELLALHERYANDAAENGGARVTSFTVLRADELSADELSTLQAQARLRLHADGRPLPVHVNEWVATHEQALAQRREVAAVALAPGPAVVGAAPSGEFDPGSGEFRFDVSADLAPARPWINVLANPSFGAHLSEAGGGYSWALNSRLMQLTAWSNDPVADPSAEWLLLQDLASREVWSVTPNAFGAQDVSYHVAHGQGYSLIRHRRGGLEVTVTWCVDPLKSVKQVRLEFVNRGRRALRLRVVGIAEWMMGANRAERRTVRTSLHRSRQGEQALGTLLCEQRERSGGFGQGTAFFALSSALGIEPDWTCDRRECFDEGGGLILPERFGQRSGEGLDPCAALSTRVALAVGEAAQCVFWLGYGETENAARQLATQAAATPPEQRMADVIGAWDSLLGATTVHTPDPLFDAMVNRWLLYQTVACRLWARSGFYQAGGATGFRDQLQDAMALAWAAPALLRQQIVLCASRQFAAGDVQHWWHAPLGNGVRTHFSDDLLWLPHACAHYLRATGDQAVLDQRVPFLEGAAIPEGAEDAYYTPTISAEDATVFEHAARSIDRSLRVGPNGLPLMGSGDWNDGMNRVGIMGRGESVWLGWFLCQVVADFAPLARQRGEAARAHAWEQAAQGWRRALASAAWDGQWFKRAFFDEGQALGSHTNAEARIDLIVQAWGVLSHAAPANLQRLALAAVETHLVDRTAGLIRLLDPPLARASPSAGYIQAYPAGVRENGGQYAHAGVWALMAQAQAQREKIAAPSAEGGDIAYRYFTYLSPAHRSQHPLRGPAYGLEPYVMAGDVYSHKPYVGRGGWSWYTGAAGWLHRAAIESIFGLQLTAHELRFQPCLPSSWQRAELTLRREGRQMRFILMRTSTDQVRTAASELQAQVLRPDEPLDWTSLPADACFVIPLPEESRPVTNAAS